MPVEAVDGLCPYCNCVVTYYCDGGVISSPDYTLVADLVFHSACWDKQVEEHPP
jgi:hypothetical protein